MTTKLRWLSAEPTGGRATVLNMQKTHAETRTEQIARLDGQIITAVEEADANILCSSS